MSDKTMMERIEELERMVREQADRIAELEARPQITWIPYAPAQDVGTVTIYSSDPAAAAKFISGHSDKWAPMIARRTRPWS